MKMTDGRIRHTSTAHFLLAKPGNVNQDSLNSLDWKTQLMEFLRTYGRTGTAKFERKASEETLRNRTDVLFKTMRLIMEDKRFQSLSQVKPKHMARIMELWTQEGVGARARINYFTHMRWFWQLCGKPLEPIKNFEKEPGEYTITRTATRDRSWKGNDIAFDEIYKLYLAEDPVAARLLLTMSQYGLRLKESICLRPNEADGGNCLEITRGSKTGRARQIVFEDFGDANFRRVLDELKSQVGPGVHLAWSNRTLKQAKERMRYLAKKFGLTRNKLGATYHGLRHDFAIDQLEKLTGQIAPVRGGIAINYKALSDARQKVTNALGHYRLEVTGCYYGSFASLEREQLRHFIASWTKLESVTHDIWRLLDGNGATNLFWIGARAVGHSKSPTVAFEFVLEPGMDPVVAARLSPQISELVLGATGVDCVVRPWEALPGAQQMIWENESVPVFAPVSPLETMKARLAEQRQARLASNSALTS